MEYKTMNSDLGLDSSPHPSASLPRVAVVMGSASDWETMKESHQILKEFGVIPAVRVISAHRSPSTLFRFGQEARSAGYGIIIAGAGGAAHLPGMLSALTTIPVLGVPVQSRSLQGLDSLLSIVQMPGGVPTATFAIGPAGAKNAGLFALQILSLQSKELQSKLEAYKEKLDQDALSSSDHLPLGLT